MITKTEKQVAAFFAVLVALAAIAWFTIEPAYANDKKVTICHATSSETNPFVTITISENAVYGPGGHFNENGTTQAGHEQDYFGACQGEEEPPEETEPEETTPEETTPTEPPVVPCVPQNPDGSLGGKDGKPGNDDCAADPVDPTGPPTTPEEPSSTPEPEVPSSPSEPEGEQPSAGEAPSGSKPPKVVDVKPGKKPGTVIITTDDGEQHVGVQGSG